MTNVTVAITAPTIETLTGAALAGQAANLAEYATREGRLPLSRHPGWLSVLQEGLGHTPYCLRAMHDGDCQGILPLAAVKSWLFGHFLVGLPYLNYGGPLTDDAACQGALLQSAKELADGLNV